MTGHIKTTLRGEDWLAASSLQRVFDVLEREGEARVAGGAVRDALLGRPVSDVDVATTLDPNRVTSTLRDAGIKVVPTGLDHGTVTVVAGPDHADVYEVTTLRVDVETDGRRAKVAFTDDWAADAGRRDFTMNALYCDRNGELLDPLGGYDDLKERRVRFAGEASQRITEDYLRILRFFRFNAVFGWSDLHRESLEACIAHRTGLGTLSAERIRQELLKLLAAKGALAIVEIMHETGVLSHVVPTQTDVARLSRLVELERSLDRVADPVLRLACLCVNGPDDTVKLRQALKLTNRETDRLSAIAANRNRIDPGAAQVDHKRQLYEVGMPGYLDLVLFEWADANDDAADSGWSAAARLPEVWTAPRFPLTGAQLLAKGMTAGPRVGEVLKAMEAWWIGQDFPEDETVVQAQLRSMLDSIGDE